MSSSAAAFARASRPLFSSASAAAQTRQAFSRASGFQQAFRSQQRQQWGRRWQSTASAEQQAAQQVGWFKRMWDSPIGFKTVHFWAPVMKVRRKKRHNQKKKKNPEDFETKLPKTR